jgi:hypothetical protein
MRFNMKCGEDVLQAHHAPPCYDNVAAETGEVLVRNPFGSLIQRESNMKNGTA